MADNVTLDPGTGGAVIATDDDGVAQHQYVKVEFGADNTQTKVTSAVGLPTDPLDRAARDLGKVDVAMGQAAHDAAGATLDPVATGGYASAAAPADVSADDDIVRAWHLRNGAQAVNLTAAGALIPGNATDGLLVNLGTNNDVVASGTVTANIGTAGTLSLEATQGSVLTSVQLIDDTIKVLGTDTYTEATTKGSVVAAVRRDADTSAANTDNEVTPLLVDANGYLKVEIFDGGGSHTVDGTVTANIGTSGSLNLEATQGSVLTSVQLIDDTIKVLGTDTYTEATTKGSVIGAVRRDADTSAANTDNEITPLLVDANGYLKVEIFDGGGSHTVDGTVTANAGTNLNTSALNLETTQASVLTAVQKIDDPVQVLGTDTYTEATSSGMTLGAVRRDADTTLVGTTNEFSPLQVDANGRLKVEAFSGETLPVSGTVTANLGTIAGVATETTLGSVLTSVQLQDDTVATLGTTTYSEATTKGTTMGAVRRDAATSPVGTDNEIGPLTMTASGAVRVSTHPDTTGGLTVFRSLDLDETEEEVSAVACNVYGIWFSNMATSTRFLKLYNATAANTTVGTTTPIITLALPGNTSDDISGMFSSTHGIAFATALSAAATTGIADADTGAPAANDVLVNLFIK